MSAHAIVHGFHAVTARLRDDAAGIQEIYISAARGDGRARDLRKLAAERGVRLIEADAARLDGLTGQARHQGVAARVTVRARAADIDEVLAAVEGPPLLLVLDGVQDPHNLGACLRVADALGVHAVIAPRDRAVGITPTVERVACGAAQTVNYLTVTNLARTLRELKEQGIWVFGADAGGEETLYDTDLTMPLAWVLGAEGEGLRRLTREHCDKLVQIPMSGSVASLNISVAAGICLSEATRQRRMLPT